MKRTSFFTLLMLLAASSFCQVQNRSGRAGAIDTTGRLRNSGIADNVLNNKQNNVAVDANKPLTVDELNQKVVSLQAAVDQLNKRLPYSGVAFLTITVDQHNLNSQRNSVRIDHEFCNGNPHSKIFLESNGVMQKLVYDNGYWYVQGGYGINGIDNTEIIHRYSDQTGQSLPPALKEGNAGGAGILVGAQHHFYIGETIQVIIVKDLPDYNPAIRQIMNLP